MRASNKAQILNKARFIDAVAANGGTALTDYKTSQEKVRIRCNKGHEWDVTPNNIINVGSWCPKCARDARRSHKSRLDARQRFLDIVDAKGGIALTEYQNSGSKVRIRCEHGHEWDATPNNIVKGSWCPERPRKHSDVAKQRFLGVVAAKGGTSLTEYTHCQKKVLIRCKKGHEWHARPNDVVSQGTWCPHCASEARRRPRD